MSEHQSDIYQLINKTVADHVDQTTKDLRTDIQDMKNMLQQYLTMNLTRTPSRGGMSSGNRVSELLDSAASSTPVTDENREYITQVINSRQMKRRAITHKSIQKVEWHKTGHEGRQTRNLRAVFQPFDGNSSFPNLLVCAGTKLTYRAYVAFLCSIEDEDHEIQVEKWIESKTGLQKEWNKQGVYKDAIINAAVSLERIGFLERSRSNRKISFRFTAAGNSLDRYLFDEDRVEDLPENELLESQIFKAHFPEDLSFLNEDDITPKKERRRKRKGFEDEDNTPDNVNASQDMDFGHDSALATLASTSESEAQHLEAADALKKSSYLLSTTEGSTPMKQRKRSKKTAPVEILGKYKRGGDECVYKIKIADDIQERTLLETLRLSRSRDILTAISQYEARHCVPHDPEHDKTIKEAAPVVLGSEHDVLLSIKREGSDDIHIERYENVAMTHSFKQFVFRVLGHIPTTIEFAESTNQHVSQAASTTTEPTLPLLKADSVATTAPAVIPVTPTVTTAPVQQ